MFFRIWIFWEEQIYSKLKFYSTRICIYMFGGATDQLEIISKWESILSFSISRIRNLLFWTQNRPSRRTQKISSTLLLPFSCRIGMNFFWWCILDFSQSTNNYFTWTRLENITQTKRWIEELWYFLLH